MLVLHRQLAVGSGNAKHREGAALTFAQIAEADQAFGRNRQHIALLRLVAPYFAGAHAGLFAGQCAQLEGRAATGIMGEFGHGVGNAAGTDIVYGQNRIPLALLPAAVDDFLRPPLDLRIAALH